MSKDIYVGGTIRLDQFLKWTNTASTGGTAKNMIREGMVKVNHYVETRRGKKLADGDLVEVEGDIYRVVYNN